MLVHSSKRIIHSFTHSFVRSVAQFSRSLAWSIVCVRNVKISRANKTNCMAREMESELVKWQREWCKKENYYVSNEYYVLSVLGSAILLSHIQTLIRMEQQHQLCYTFILQYINKCAMCVCVCWNEGTRREKITPTSLPLCTYTQRVYFSHPLSLYLCSI